MLSLSTCDSTSTIKAEGAVQGSFGVGAVANKDEYILFREGYETKLYFPEIARVTSSKMCTIWVT